MTSRTTVFATRSFIVLSLVAFAFFGYGCGGNDNASLSGQFTGSATAAGTLHLIKLVPKTASGDFIVVQAVIYGPDVSLDMYAFAFDVKIGDTGVVQYVANSAAAGNALTLFAGQGVQVLAAPDGTDPSHIVVGVSKTGGPPGNGVSGASAVIVELTFRVLKQGTTTLALTGSTAIPTQPPTVLDSASPPQPIAVITFDSANGTVTAISTGGGGY
jgi:hypothetical protein